jgi:hypothetical protein
MRLESSGEVPTSLIHSMRASRRRVVLQVGVSASLSILSAGALWASSTWTVAAALALMTTQWAFLAVLPWLDGLRPMPLFFRGAPPRLGGVDGWSAAALLVFVLYEHQVEGALALGFASSLATLRLLRWTFEWRALPWSEGSEIKRSGFLTGIDRQVGWSVRHALRSVSWTQVIRWTQVAGDDVDVDYRRNARPPEQKVLEGAETAIPGALDDDSAVLRQGGPSELPAPDPHGPGVGLLFVAPLVGVLGAYLIHEVLLPPLVAGAWVAFGSWRREGSPSAVLILESPVAGLARWLPFALTGAVAVIVSRDVLASALVRTGVSAGISAVAAVLAGLSWTFLVDRLSRLGFVVQHASGVRVLKIHGSAVPITGARTAETDVLVETIVGSLRVTWPGLPSLAREREMAQALISILVTGPGARVDPRRGFVDKAGRIGESERDGSEGGEGT